MHCSVDNIGIEHINRQPSLTKTVCRLQWGVQHIKIPQNKESEFHWLYGDTSLSTAVIVIGYESEGRSTVSQTLAMGKGLVRIL